MSDAGGPAARDVAPGELPPYDCLWCGRAWRPRAADDLEALARLCPTCLGRADSNEFLRFRLRAALDARARDAIAAAPVSATPREPAAESARDVGSDDWYLRRGRHALGQVQDLAWHMDLDAATTWLDRLPIRGRIVELAAGTGWWSALLASKGELSAFDAAPAMLDRVRERLVAHHLRAHLHVRDPWLEPDAATDVLFAALWLGRVPGPRLPAFLALARRWLRPGGLFAFIDVLPAAHAHADLAAALVAAGFGEVAITTTSRYLALGSARADGESIAPAGMAATAGES